MQKIDSLVEAYLTAERELVVAVDAAGGAVPLPDGRTVSVGRADKRRCRRADDYESTQMTASMAEAGYSLHR